jgi:hypothetical protein
MDLGSIDRLLVGDIMKHNCTRLLRFFMAVASLALITGCYGKREQITTDIPVYTQTLISTSTVIQSTQTSTATLPKDTPTVLAQQKVTSTSTSTPTIEVLPTLGFPENEIEIQALLTDNPGCDLPCIWSITPGFTTPSGLISFLRKFEQGEISQKYFLSTSEHSNGGLMTAGITKDNQVAAVSFGYIIKNGTILSVSINADYWQNNKAAFGGEYFTTLFKNYQLPHLLQKYGIPSRAFIYIESDIPNPPKDYYYNFYYVLVYDSQGFLIEYLTPREIVGDEYKGCSSKATHFSIVSWKTGTQPTIEEMMKYLGGQLSVSFARLKPLEEATAMSMDNFYQKYKNSDACITSHDKIWQLP